MSMLAGGSSMPAATTTNAARVNTYRQAEAVPFIVGTGRLAPKWISDRFNDHWSNGKMTGQAYCSIVGVLCHGPVDRVGAVFQSGAEIWNVNLTRSGGATYGSFSFGGPDSQFGPTYVGRIYYGTDEQTADAWLVAKTGQDHPPMRGICYVVFERLHCGQVTADSRAQPAVPNIEFTVSRLPSPTIPAGLRFPTSLDSEWWRGVNPVSALYDILTHPRAGLDCAEYLDTAAWAAAAQGIEDGSKRVFGADGLYARLSPLLTGGTDAESAINTFLEYFDGFVTSSNGLIGIDWFPNDGNTPSGLPTITQHDLAKVPEIDLSLLDDVPTSVAVTCLDYWAELSEAVEARNVPFTKQGRGDSSPKKLDRPWILDRDAAAEYAARQAALSATPDASGKLSVLLHRAVRADGSPLRPGDQFLLNYEPDSLLFICRVTEIEEPDDDDAVVELSFIREHGTSALPYVPEVDPRADYELPTPATPGADDWLVVETPPDIGDGKAIVLIRRSQQTLAGAEVEMDDDNAWAAGSSVLGSQGFAAWASLTADITDTATTCTISGTGVDLSPTLGSGRTTTEQADNTLLAYCGGEWLSIGAVTSVATDTYQLAILRGRLGIAAAAHTTGAAVWIILRAEIVQWSHALFTSEATRYFKIAYYHALETGTPSDAKALTFRESVPDQRWVNLYTYNGYPLSSQYKPANTYIPSLGRGAKTLAECPLANWHESPAAAQSAYSASHGGSSPMDTVIPPFDGTASVEGSPLMYTCAGLVYSDGSFVSLYGAAEWSAIKHYTPPIVTTKAVINNAGTFVEAIANTDTESEWTPKLVAGSTPIQLREAAGGGLEYTTDEGETVNPMGGGGGTSLPEPTVGQMLYCAEAGVWTPLAAPGVVGQVLTGVESGSSTIPQWVLPATAYTPRVAKWVERITLAGGTLTDDSEDIATALINAMTTRPWAGKIVYLLPFLGGNLAAALVPLIDQRDRGVPINTGFDDADFTEASGLQGAASKWLDTQLTAAHLGASGSGGIGHIELTLPTTPVAREEGGYADSATDRRFGHYARTVSPWRMFWWGNPANRCESTAALATGHIYGQRSSATLRRLFIDGVAAASNTTSDAAELAAQTPLYALGSQQGLATDYGDPIRCGAWYATDGTLSDAEVADLYDFLDEYLITPTGR